MEYAIPLFRVKSSTAVAKRRVVLMPVIWKDPQKRKKWDPAAEILSPLFKSHARQSNTCARARDRTAAVPSLPFNMWWKPMRFSEYPIVFVFFVNRRRNIGWSHFFALFFSQVKKSLNDIIFDNRETER